MPHSKTPGGAGASEKFLKQQAESAPTPFLFYIHPSAYVSFSLANILNKRARRRRVQRTGAHRGQGAGGSTGTFDLPHFENFRPPPAPPRLYPFLVVLPADYEWALIWKLYA